MGDELLVGRAAMGDQQAFAQLVRPLASTLYAAARAILRDDEDARDCVQEAILKGWEKLPSLRERRYFATWLTRIAITTAINCGRRRRPGAALPANLAAPSLSADERLDIRRAIDKLDPRTRVCVVLYYFEDMTVEQIARAVGIRQGTVKSRLFRAREKLRGILEGYDHGR